MKKRFIFIFSILVLLAFSISITSEGSDSPTRSNLGVKKTTYTPDTALVEYNNSITFSKAFYQGRKFADSNGTLIQNAKSLLYTEFPIPLALDIDPSLNLTILDYNYTNYHVCIQANQSGNIPLTIYDQYNTSNILKTVSINIKKNMVKVKHCYNISTDKLMGRVLKWGLNSSTVIYNVSSYDGYVMYQAQPAIPPNNPPIQSDWDNTHNGLTGDIADTNGATYEIGASMTPESFGLRRTSIPINVSLPSNANITSASFYLFVRGVNNMDNDGVNSYIVIVANTSLNNSPTLGTEDYDMIDVIGTSVEISSQNFLGSLSNDAWTTLNITQTGLTYINTNGMCLWGIIEGHDSNDVMPTADSSLNADSSEGMNVPYLNITYDLIVTGNTCSCPTSASNLVINCNENCTINNCDMQGYNIIINGAGRLNAEGNLTNYKNITWDKSCSMAINKATAWKPMKN